MFSQLLALVEQRGVLTPDFDSYRNRNSRLCLREMSWVRRVQQSVMHFGRVRFAGEQRLYPRQELSGIRTSPILAKTLRRWRLAQSSHRCITRTGNGLIENRTGNSLMIERLGAVAWNWLGGRDSNSDNVVQSGRKPRR